VERLDGVQVPNSATLRVLSRSPTGRDAAVGYLDHLTIPATRWVLFSAGDRWTAVLTNHIGGSDFHDELYGVVVTLSVRVCRVVDRPTMWKRVNDFRVRMAWAGRIFELVAPGSEGWTVLRSIYAVDDGGRWDFRVGGAAALPVERTFDYDARLKRDRFTSANLGAVLDSLGVRAPVPATFDRTSSLWLVAAELGPRLMAEVERDACTSVEADDPGYAYFRRGLKWVSHMDTHASSVAVDFTQAALLSLELERTVRPHLAEARRVLGEAEFDRLRRAAEVALRRNSRSR
jgi:hypothetical protein